MTKHVEQQKFDLAEAAARPMPLTTVVALSMLSHVQGGTPAGGTLVVSKKYAAWEGQLHSHSICNPQIRAADQNPGDIELMSLLVFLHTAPVAVFRA